MLINCSWLILVCFSRSFIELKTSYVRRQALGVSRQTESLVACVAFAKKPSTLPLTLKLESLISGVPALECKCVLASFHKTEQMCIFVDISTERRPDIASCINLYG